MLRLMRGLAILTKDPLDQAGFQDLSDALDGADLISVELRQASDKIDCFVLMTACFIVLRQPAGAIASIVAQMQLLLIRDETLRRSLHNLDESLNSTPNKALWREDKTLLDSLFTAVCAAITVCETLDSSDDQLSLTFQQMWLPLLPLTQVHTPNTEKWQSLRIYKMAQHESWAAAVAVPGIVLAPIEPVLGFLAVGWTVGSLSVGTGTAVWTKKLHEFDSFNNFYVWRHAIEKLLQGKRQYGNQKDGTTVENEDEEEEEAGAVLVSFPTQASDDLQSGVHNAEGKDELPRS
jgi:hypothetical protein